MVPFTDLLSAIIDNRGRSCPTSNSGWPLIATNCIGNDHLYPTYEKIRYVSEETYRNWFRAHPKPTDLIFVTKGSPGRVCLAPNPVDFCIAQDMVAVRPDPEKIYAPYLFAALRSAQIQDAIASMHVGTLIPHFKKGDFDKLLIPVPEDATQRRIGDMYLSFSEKIEINRRMNLTLEEMARTLFQSWFVDFDPVRAKVAGRQPTGMGAATAALFPESLTTIDGEELPAGWSRRRLSSLVDINGWTLRASDPLQLLEYIDISNVVRGDVVAVQRFVRGSEPGRARRRVRHGDTLLSTVRPDRRSYFLSINPPENLIASTGFAVLTPRNIPWSFVYAAATQPAVFEHLGRVADGGAYPAVRSEAIGEWPVTIPSSSSILQEFASISQSLLERANSNRIESKRLTSIRDALLPRLLSGDLESVTPRPEPGELR